MGRPGSRLSYSCRSLAVGTCPAGLWACAIMMLLDVLDVLAVSMDTFLHCVCLWSVHSSVTLACACVALVHKCCTMPERVSRARI